jgi:regulator of cell morphogenesis and NO signaling
MPYVDHSATIAQIVTDHAVAARVFQKYGIDFCCRGNVSVAEACRTRPVAPEALFEELETAVAEGAGSDGPDPRTLSTPALIALIVDRHHGYLRRALPYLQPLAEKVAKVHGPHNPKLQPLLETFVAVRGALEPHIDDEEQNLFPALAAPQPDRESIARQVASMNEEHLAVGSLLEQMRTLSDGYATPEWGCNSYRVLMAELEALEGDVLRHVHLENHVLVPRFSTPLA